MLHLLSDRAWLWIAAAFYTGAFLSVTVALVRSAPRPRALLFALVGVGLITQTLGLYQRGLQVGGCPLHNTFEIIQFIVWSFTVLFLVVGPAFRVSLLGYFTSGLAASMSLCSLLVKHWDSVTRTPIFGGDPLIEIHASLALFAYGAFGTLALTSLMFLLQTFSLKQKRLRGLFSFLPPIVALESINFRLLLTGLAVLTVAVGLGAQIYFQDDSGALGGGKLLISVGVWAAYFVVLYLRLRRLLVSNGLAWTCLALFGIALLSLGPINAGSHPSTPAEPASRILGAVHDAQPA